MLQLSAQVLEVIRGLAFVHERCPGLHDQHIPIGHVEQIDPGSLLVQELVLPIDLSRMV